MSETDYDFGDEPGVPAGEGRSIEECVRDRETNHQSKKVMMRAEHTDVIDVDGLGECTVVKRDQTYYGPRLRIEPVGGGEQYVLHAPGPRSALQLSASDGTPLRSVSAELEGVKQYDICLHCGEPLRSVEHRRRSVTGTCTGGGSA
ncbi:hypothetical protein [Halomontanus rarus]|uniref:hypothetical protein n=1 Tax=Halomontanus rarus TaxID=3034020 RepID=UPI00307C5DB7